MEIQIKESTIVRPAQETPKHRLQVTDLDLLLRPAHIPNVYFYRRPNDSSNFFEAGLMKESLSKVLVPYYPLAGRFRRDGNGRLEIECNGEGVLFLEAETSCVIDDLGDFTQSSKLLHLFPTVDYTKEISSLPFLVVQVTRFKCGGIGFGFGLHHSFGDATSIIQFINAWAEMTRGVPISIQPIFDRTLLTLGVPASPTFHHVEYDPPPSMNTLTQNKEFQPNSQSISAAILHLSLDQINVLKVKSKKDYSGSTINYTKFEILAAHIWRCLCRARGLSDNQASKIHIATDGRSRLNPPLPHGFIGNAIFVTTLVASAGDIQSEPLSDTAERFHKALKQMNDEYLKSIMAYLKQQPDLTVLTAGGHIYKSPNLNLSYVARVPFYDADFGWGRPIFVRTITLLDGIVHVFPSPSNDGSLNAIINLETRQIQLLKKLFYEIFCSHIPCKI